MGFSGISQGSLLLIFFIALLLFGPKKLQSFGKELGVVIRAFREGLKVDKPADKYSSQA